MSVTTASVSNQYNANGSQTVFSYTFPISKNTEIVVRLGDTIMAITTDYSVDGVGVSSGGTVTFLTPPANGIVVTLTRSTTLTRPADYQESGSFYAVDVNADFDRLTKVDAELSARIDRAVSFPFSSTFDPSDVAMPDPQAGALLRWNDDADNLENVQLGTIAGTPVGLPMLVSQGGTSATSATAARTNLAVPGLGDNNTFSGNNTFTGTNQFNKTVTMSGAAINGANVVTIPAATTTDLSAANSNDVYLSGTSPVTITGWGTVAVGAKRWVRNATGVNFTIKYNSNTNNISATDIVMVPNDIAVLRSISPGQWIMDGYFRANGQSLANKYAQVVSFETGAVAAGNTAIPLDDTIPQNTEGDQYMSLAITPTNASSTLFIDVTMFLGGQSSAGRAIAALFQDATASAIGVGTAYSPGTTGTTVVSFRHKMTAGTTSATTFKVRAGCNVGGVTLNGESSGRMFGGVFASSITITEILP